MYFSTISKVLQLLTFIHWPMDTLIEFDYDINKCWSFKGDPCKDFFLVFNIHNVEFSRFLCHSDFTWNQFWSFWSIKNCHFDHLISSEFWTFGDFWQFLVWNFSTNQNSKPSKLLNQQILTFWNPPKLISRKIRGQKQF